MTRRLTVASCSDSLLKSGVATRRLFCAFEIVHPFKVLPKHFSIEKDQGAQCLVLG